MNKLFIVKDKTEGNIHKPFVSIHKVEGGAERKVSQMKIRLSKASQDLVSYESVDVTDFDMNKKHVYVVFNKADATKKMQMFFDFNVASSKVLEMKKTLPSHSQKMVFAKMFEVE